jgi:hypothetical protein
MEYRTPEVIIAELRQAVVALARTQDPDSRTALEALIKALADEHERALELRNASVHG